MTEPPSSRRDFCKTPAAGSALLHASSPARAAGANKRLHFGVIGCGGMGTGHLDGTPSLRFNGDFKEEFRKANGGKDEAKSAVVPSRDMVGNFLDAIRDGAVLNCNAELGTATMVAIKLAVESYRQKKTMTWDAKKEKVG